ncbi:MAG: folylpolyglutamate synthase/dihydrofolate synthase family protein [Kiritimatiellia bacterium]|nr:folylpolyglutamate synthase/dihydrofolate synthase family protein [Kiritimatiellia bacterium]MDP6811392.1 folylpolyglutamate synthase/dihydrofolate synthase family protein [Kiritimatiellia bacterium]MDP7023812.1 folylpolyglutamate synthase/dihydrofolate synthase family protein [Kiritimatiellia bacterium]
MTQQIERLFARRRLGIKPGIETVAALMDVLGHPEESFAAVHVAGTNGKGSVCAMVASILREAEYRTGLFTSPHLIRLNERFRVNGEMVDDATLTQLMSRVETAAEEVDARRDQPVTFFECSAALAFEHFRNSGVQLAVLETGMGGRLDATNVVRPAVSVITRIAMDHSDYLGDDLAAIAGEKGGIIKPGRPVVIGAMPAEAREVLVRLAAERGAPLCDAAETISVDLLDMGLDGLRVKISTPTTIYPPMTVPLLGEHQLENIALAVAACEVLRDDVRLPVSESAVAAGLVCTEWEGRLQVLQRDPVLLVDGAHNPDAAHALARALRRLMKGQPVGLVLGMCADKQIRATLQELAVLKPKVWTVPLTHSRGMAQDELQHLAVSAGLDAVASADLGVALTEAQEWARRNEGCVCVAGSLFLAGEVLEWWQENRR